MTVASIIKHHSSAGVTVVEGNDFLTVSNKLTEHDVGVAVVLNGAGRLVGIITERDMVRTFSLHKSKISSLRASDIMTRSVYTCRADEAELRVLTRMREYNVRYMPVLEEGKLIGIVSLDQAVQYRLKKIQRLDAALLKEPDEAKQIGMFTRYLVKRRNELAE